MLEHRLAERAENDAELCQLALECRRHRDAVEHGIDRNPGQCLALAQRDSELLIGAQQLGIDFVQRFRAGILLRRGVIGGRLIIDRRQIELGPIRRRHLLPGAKRCEPPFEQPFGFALFGRNEMNRFLAEAGRRLVGFDVSDKAVFVALLRQRADGADCIDRSSHMDYLGSSVCSGVNGCGGPARHKRGRRDHRIERNRG